MLLAILSGGVGEDGKRRSRNILQRSTSRERLTVRGLLKPLTADVTDDNHKLSEG